MADVIKYRFRCRRRTAAEWTSVNEILLAQEIGLEEDTGLGKIGDGTTAWNDLLYTIVGEVDLSALADGKCLVWNGTSGHWEAGIAGGRVDAVVAGTNISVNNLDPTRPVVSSTVGAINLKDRLDVYADLPSTGNTSGDAYLVDGPPQQIYVWNGTAWPAEGSGIAPGGGTDVPDYAATVLADGPIGFWAFDDLTGTTITDSSGNGRNALLHGGYSLGVVPTVNLPGAALFDGSTGYADIAYASWMDLVGALSLEAWVLPITGPTARWCAITRGFHASGTIPYALGVQEDTGSTPQLAQYNGSSWSSVKSGVALSAMGWQHIVGTRTATGVANIYVNGVQANLPANLTIQTPQAEGMLFARNHNLSTGIIFFNGLLSSVGIYDKVLTPAQIATHYSVGSVPRWLT